jgi:hypothetical protein
MELEEYGIDYFFFISPKLVYYYFQIYCDKK